MGSPSTAFHVRDGNAEVSAKRYRYTGKERDEETGLYYHGARYYAAWLGRWTAVDPLVSPNACEYVRSRPTILRDPDGAEEEPGFWDFQVRYWKGVGQGAGARL